jgi:hypothetical protein
MAVVMSALGALTSATTQGRIRFKHSTIPKTRHSTNCWRSTPQEPLPDISASEAPHILGYTLVPPASYTHENFTNSVQTQVVGINNNASPKTFGSWIDMATNGNTFGFVDQGNTFTQVSVPNVARQALS